MRITEIREKAVRLEVNIRNAVFSFDDMTTSIVAVITDVVRDGAPVTGFAFNSTGRYACGVCLCFRGIAGGAAGEISQSRSLTNLRLFGQIDLSRFSRHYLSK